MNKIEVKLREDYFKVNPIYSPLQYDREANRLLLKFFLRTQFKNYKYKYARNSPRQIYTIFRRRQRGQTYKDIGRLTGLSQQATRLVILKFTAHIMADVIKPINYSKHFSKIQGDKYRYEFKRKA